MLKIINIDVNKKINKKIFLYYYFLKYFYNKYIFYIAKIKYQTKDSFTSLFFQNFGNKGLLNIIKLIEE